MSAETITTLNKNLVGYTSKRGNAWWYRSELDGEESNHYENHIPVEDVRRRLLNWHAIEGTISATAVVLEDDGVRTITSEAPKFKAIMRSDTGDVLHIPSSSYQIHQHEDWLIENVEHILAGDLRIGSAGLLNNGGRAWVQLEMPETMEAYSKGAVPVKYRPFLTAAGSLDGSLSTTYISGAQVVICDNTLSVALAGKDDSAIRVRHSSRSLDRIDEVRDGLERVFHTAEIFQSQVEKLTAEYVSDAVWANFVKTLTQPSSKSVRSVSMATTKAAQLNELWKNDERVAPWANSAYGVLAAVNTHAHHIQTVKGATRADRNSTRMLEGGVDKLDNSTLRLLASVR